MMNNLHLSCNQDTSSELVLLPIKDDDKLEFTTLALTAQCCKSARENDRQGGGRGDGGEIEGFLMLFLPFVSGICPSSSIDVSQLFIATANANVFRLELVGLFAMPPPIPELLSNDVRPQP